MRAVAGFLLALCLGSSVSMAGSVTQTDWSDGDGIWGPVIAWGNRFYSAAGIDCCGTPSTLRLLKPGVAYSVAGDFSGAESVFSADINGDGFMDVLGAAYWAHDITWWENVDGSGTSWTEHTVDGGFTGAVSVYPADINGDGHMDLLGAAYDADDIAWWENVDGSGTSWVKHTVDGSFDGAMSVHSADVNGDGHMDILGTAFLADDITWWQNVGGTGMSWTKRTIDGSFNGARSVCTADLNGDGHLDVLGAAYDGDDVACWLNVGGSGITWLKINIDVDFDGARSVHAADVDGDGHMDVLGAATAADDITWWENASGSGLVWTEHTIDGEFGWASSVYAADVDGDGFMDVLGAGNYSSEITWWENMGGSGTSWTEHTVAGDFDGARSVHAADVNGDGEMDVLGAAHDANDITWWDLNAFISGGSLESSVLNVQESPDWQTLDWTGTEPSGTSLAFQVRASDDPSSMGAWSDTLSSPGDLAGFLAAGDNYFQYRAILTTTDPLVTPVLDEVTVTWITTGIEGGSAAVGVHDLVAIQPNPSFGRVTMLFSLPVDSRVELVVYDMCGHTVHSIRGEYASGLHEVVVDDLGCGVYLARMTSEDFTESQRFVVIR